MKTVNEFLEQKGGMSSILRAEKKMRSDNTMVVIGGGIAGVCCAQELARLGLGKVVLISASDTLMESASIFTVTNHLDEIAVYERKTDQFKFSNPNIQIIQGIVFSIDFLQKIVFIEDGNTIAYTKLCICSGVRPHLLANHQHILGLRDLNSLKQLSSRLSTARRVAVVGNGGISLELIHELRNIDVDWIIKDKYTGSVFFDATASAFILPSLLERANKSENLLKKTDSNSAVPSSSSSVKYNGYGLGPEWVTKFGFMKSEEANSSSGQLKIHYEQQVQAISEDQGINWQTLTDNIDAASCVEEEENKSFPLLIKTTIGQIIGVDFIISATGVQPNTEFITKNNSITAPATDESGFIIVNKQMQSSIEDVYSAGDCCSYQGKDTSELYFQMKLWTQARSMGVYAAQCMCECSDQYGLDSQFELFTHITRFFGYKVVMLGRYNAQGMNETTEKLTKQIVVTSEGLLKNEWFSEQTCDNRPSSGSNSVEIWLRITPGVEYIKLVVLNGKVIGALLIGNTELEEVFENLILNRLDVSQLGIDLLDPDIDIADYFD